jgi:tRNA(Ile)-lysidine synthase
MPAPPGLQSVSPRAARLCLGVERFLLKLLREATSDRCVSACHWRGLAEPFPAQPENPAEDSAGNANPPVSRSGPSGKAPGPLQGRTLVLALSGGLDSTALAVILKLLSGRLGLRLAGAHLDHGLRPDSGQDAAFVRDLCQELGVTFVSRRVDVLALARERATGVENAGRQARREFLGEVLAEEDAGRQARREFLGEVLAEDAAGASPELPMACVRAGEPEAASIAVTPDFGDAPGEAVIPDARARPAPALCALAHQLNDLAEDQLMRLARGAGWPALGGMTAFDPSRRIVRPLLMTPREDLRRFLEELAIPWRDDPSNQDPTFTRNRFRAEILPLLARENPNYLTAAAELWRQARVDEFHWNEEMLKVLPGDSADDSSYRASGESETFLDSGSLKRCSHALRLRLYKRAVERLGPGQPLSAALHALDVAWLGRQTGKRLQFPGGKEARVERGGIRFVPGVDSSPPGG